MTNKLPDKAFAGVSRVADGEEVDALRERCERLERALEAVVAICLREPDYARSLDALTIIAVLEDRFADEIAALEVPDGE